MALISHHGSGASVDERREHPRVPTQVSAKLVLNSNRTPLDVEIVDRSMSGLRLRLKSETPVSGDVTLLSAATGRAYEARVVWKSYPYVGLSIRRDVDMRAANGVDTAALQKLWRETFAGTGGSR
ncbi:PilZ domain-containing protein [Caulobacter sp. S45]|jgi:hypothetical protein|uniref:PilZ domain-containing protein n=1 Tax=Caulobacter sp. S45 TaxID=1641861 RepID=UPI00131C1395|nr:PilZ domain-containing protein [Caulobacter sp. S45]